MSLLELPQLHLPEAGIYLEAVQFWPRADRDHHFRFVSAAGNDAMRSVLLRRGERQPRPESLPFITEAAAGPRLSEFCAHARHVVTPTGLIRRDVACRIFMYVLACAEAKDPAEPPTLEHARKMIGSAGGKYASYPGMGRSELIEIWNYHAPAVHLTAAKLFFGDRWQALAAKPSGSLLAEFLAYAESLRKRGEQHRARKSKTFLLDPAATWKVPAWVSLPKIPTELPLPTPTMLKASMAHWPRPQDVRGGADMSA